MSFEYDEDMNNKTLNMRWSISKGKKETRERNKKIEN